MIKRLKRYIDKLVDDKVQEYFEGGIELGDYHSQYITVIGKVEV